MIRQISHTNSAPIVKRTIQNISSTVTESLPKKVTEQDVLLFRQYIFSKEFEFKTTQEEIKQLFEHDGEEFFYSAFDFLFKKLGIPISLKPQVIEIPMIEDFGMAYGYTQNLLIKNSNAKKASKLETYSYIRHELQHMVQNFEMYRHKTLGEKLITFYANDLANAQLPYVDNNARNVSLEELEKQGFPLDALKFYKKLKNLLKNNNEEEYKKTLESFKLELIDEHIEEYKEFRELVIREMGELKEGSRAERRAEKFYNNTISSKLTAESKEIHAGQYNYDVRECEAFIAQEVANRDAIHHLKGEDTCYINSLKLQTKEAINKLKENEKISNEMKETALELNKKNVFNSPKAYADYMFD